MKNRTPRTLPDSNPVPEELTLWTRIDPWEPEAADIEKLMDILESLDLDAELEDLRAIALKKKDRHSDDAPRAALLLARRYSSGEKNPDEIRNIIASWLWLSAWLDSTAGTLLLVDQLVSESLRIVSSDNEGKTINGVPLADHVRKVASHWFARGVCPDLDSGKNTKFPEILSNDLAWRPKPSGPARIILERFSSNGFDLELNDYKTLTNPLPLVGGDRDPDAIVQTLKNEFPWMSSAIERIADDLALCFLNPEPWIRVRPLLLVGPPGSGKSRFARRLAELLGTGYRMIGAAGSSDNRDLEGTARGWSNHEPSAVLRLMKSAQTANPIILVDEIDKTGGGPRNGDIRRTLLGMIEPETSRRWYDECLQCHADLSAVSWIMTANEIAPISRPLRSRLAITHVGLPGPDALDAILTGMRVDLAAEVGIAADLLPPLDEHARRALQNALSTGRSLRRIKTALARALAATARKSRSLS